MQHSIHSRVFKENLKFNLMNGLMGSLGSSPLISSQRRNISSSGYVCASCVSVSRRSSSGIVVKCREWLNFHKS